TLGAINFGSGWFPTIRKRPGCSGYYTVASGLADRFREHGPYSADGLRAIGAAEIAAVLGQDPDHELMARFARALNDLGDWLRSRTPLAGVDVGSAEALAEHLAAGMLVFDDRGFCKRAQIRANDPTRAGRWECAG